MMRFIEPSFMAQPVDRNSLESRGILIRHLFGCTRTLWAIRRLPLAPASLWSVPASQNDRPSRSRG